MRNKVRLRLMASSSTPSSDADSERTAHAQTSCSLMGCLRPQRPTGPWKTGPTTLFGIGGEKSTPATHDNHPPSSKEIEAGGWSFGAGGWWDGLREEWKSSQSYEGKDSVGGPNSFIGSTSAVRASRHAEDL